MFKYIDSPAIAYKNFSFTNDEEILEDSVFNPDRYEIGYESQNNFHGLMLRVLDQLDNKIQACKYNGLDTIENVRFKDVYET